MSTRAGPRQRGDCVIAYAMLLVPLLTALGVAVDVSLAYQRRGDMQRLADGVALAAAATLDGSLGGVDRALARAAAAADAHAAALALPLAWSPAALRLGATADGPWRDARAVDATEVGALVYADVDTARLDAPAGSLPALVARVAGHRELMAGARAVATRAEILSVAALRARVDGVDAVDGVVGAAAAAPLAAAVVVR